ncbi:hypothetical protein CR513_60127, partial [Mucuna pruriens]
MDYIYEAIGSKRRFKKLLMARKRNRRWDCQLHHPLHAPSYFLNSGFFYSNPNNEMDCEMVKGLYKCIERLNENDESVDHIHNELSIYKRVGGMFGFPATVRKRTTMAL